MLDTHTDYLSWWENVATIYKAIAHDPDNNNAFARVIDTSRSPFQPYYYDKEFYESLKDSMSFPCLIAESTKDRYKYANGNHQESSGGIIVLLDTEGRNDFDSMNDALSKAKAHCGKLIGYLQKYLKDNPAEGHLHMDSVLIHGVGPIGDALFGARAEFVIKTTNCSVSYDADDWD